MTEMITTLGDKFYDDYMTQRETLNGVFTNLLNQVSKIEENLTPPVSIQISTDLTQVLPNQIKIMKQDVQTQVMGIQINSALNTVNKILNPIEDFNNNMSIAEFESFSVFSDNKEKDQARFKADQYFLEHVQYHIDPKILEILDWKKPELNAERLKIINSADVKTWYTNYAKLWVVLVADDQLKGKIKSKVIKEDLQKMTSSEIYAKQIMLTYNYAYCELVPRMKLYIRSAEVSKSWAKKAKDYYLSEEYGKVWMAKLREQQKIEVKLNYAQDTLNLIPTLGKKWSDSIPKDFNSLDYVTSDIRAKIDMLDPSGKTSDSVVGYLQNVSLANQILGSGINDEEFNNHLEANVTTIFKGYQKLQAPTGTQQPIVTFVKDFAGLPGGISAAIKTTCEIIKATRNRYKVYLVTDAYNASVDTLSLSDIDIDFVDTVVNEHPDAKKLATLTNCRKIFASIFRTCQAMVLFIGFSNFDPSAPFRSNAQFVGDSLAMVGDFLTSFEKVNNAVTARFGQLANRIGPILSKIAPAKLGNFFSKYFTKIFTSNANNFLSYRVCPLLLLVAVYNNIWDAKTSLEEKNWGGFACDLAQIGCNITAAGILFAGIPFAAIGAIVLGALAVGFFLIKMIFFPAKSSIEKYFESQYFPKEYIKTAAA
ncbi:hypothetical protein CYY_009054 [Polysphondylium violaceum]|uniref:Uncharacterized protein n=1 Tax=Polysphondylium violaceum TaxID=133409 RepID=A0A8J4PKT1_9MYCE|nr:hypothetical protein CYY_009054 [Polysphondylium violaceum]